MTQATYEEVTAAVHALEAEEIHGRLRWSAIIGGTAAALGVGVLLYTLGLALGLTSVDVDDPSSLKTSGIFTGVWGLVAPLAALFIGGLVASRAATVATRGAGIMHGLVVWALTTLMGVWLIVNVVAATVGGAASAVRSVGSVGGAALGQVAQGAGGVGTLAQGLGVSWNDAIAPVNRRLQAQGKPAITAQQVEDAAKDVVQTAVREGRLDRGILTSAIADKTALSRADAEEIAASIESQLRGVSDRAQRSLGNAAQSVQSTALTAVDRTGKAFWGVFGALLAGLLAALGGALFGASERMQDAYARAQLKAHARVPGVARAGAVPH